MSVAGRLHHRGGQSVVLSSDSDSDCEDLRTLSRRLSGAHARKQVPCFPLIMLFST